MILDPVQGCDAWEHGEDHYANKRLCLFCDELSDDVFQVRVAFASFDGGNGSTPSCSVIGVSLVENA